MNIRLSRRAAAWIGATLVVAGVGVSHIIEGMVASWQLGVWRVDRDDLYDWLMGLAALITALAAWRRASRADRRQRENEYENDAAT